MVISETDTIVIFILLIISIIGNIGNTVFIGLYISDRNAERIAQYERRQQGFDEQKERVEKTIRECPHCSEPVRGLKDAPEIAIHRVTELRRCADGKTFAEFDEGGGDE